MSKLGKNILGFNVNEWRDVELSGNQENPDEPFPIALAMGLDPAIMIAAGIKTNVDELLIAGAIRAKPIEVCKGQAVDIDIPASAEVVVEGFYTQLKESLKDLWQISWLPR